MTEAGAAPTGADEGGSSQYVFVFQVKRTEADIEGSFLTKSGTLGAAAALAGRVFCAAGRGVRAELRRIAGVASLELGGVDA